MNEQIEDLAQGRFPAQINFYDIYYQMGTFSYRQSGSEENYPDEKIQGNFLGPDQGRVQNVAPKNVQDPENEKGPKQADAENILDSAQSSSDHFNACFT